MRSLLKQLAVAGGLSVIAGVASAYPSLPGVENLNFVDYTGAAPKAEFSAVKPTGWTGGGGLIFVDAPGAPGCAACADGPTYLTVYGPFPKPPIPGNYVEADGNPDFEGSFSQALHGLTIGKTYTLSFFQAGGQQLGFASGLATTEQWVVSLGTVGLSVKSGGPVDPVYGNTDVFYSTDPTASIVESAAMVTPSGGVTPWQFVSVNVTADATDELLSFLAWGDHGSTINLPPIVFLSGVDSPDVLLTPEPATVGLFGIGLLGFGVHRLRRRSKKA